MDIPGYWQVIISVNLYPPPLPSSLFFLLVLSSSSLHLLAERPSLLLLLSQLEVVATGYRPMNATASRFGSWVYAGAYIHTRTRASHVFFSLPHHSFSSCHSFILHSLILVTWFPYTHLRRALLSLVMCISFLHLDALMVMNFPSIPLINATPLCHWYVRTYNTYFFRMLAS